jgi:hypothetical protein
MGAIRDWGAQPTRLLKTLHGAYQCGSRAKQLQINCICLGLSEPEKGRSTSAGGGSPCRCHHVPVRRALR